MPRMKKDRRTRTRTEPTPPAPRELQQLTLDDLTRVVGAAETGLFKIQKVDA